MAMPRKAIREVKGGAMVQCADKSPVVFYAGASIPFSFDGCYLIYDAVDRSLTPVHHFPYPVSRIFRIGGPVVLRRPGGGDGAYVLVGLVRRTVPWPPSRCCTHHVVVAFPRDNPQRSPRPVGHGGTFAFPSRCARAPDHSSPTWRSRWGNRACAGPIYSWGS
ncbi:hypothetical protein ABZP36_009739 [Zizania latifolia]